MFGLRSARSRVVALLLMLVVVLAAAVAVAVWSGRDMDARHQRLIDRSEVVAAVQDARAEDLTGSISFMAAAFTEDMASVVDFYRERTAERDEALRRARAGLAALNDADAVAGLDELIEMAEQEREATEELISLAGAVNVDTRVTLAQDLYPQMWPDYQEFVARLDGVVTEQSAALDAEEAAADRASHISLGSLIGASVVASLGAAGAFTALVLSVVRPLASLRTAARAVATDNAETVENVGGPEEVASLARDLNEMVRRRKQAEQAAREQADYLQSTLDALGLPFYVIDADDYRIKMANVAARPPESLRGKTCYEITHRRSEPCSGDADVCPLQEVKRTKRAVTVEHTHYDADGSARIHEVHCHPMLDADGNVKEVLEFAPDITERKRTEEALLESESKFRQIFENVQDIYFRTEPSGTIVELSPAVERFGYTRDQLIGTSVLDIYEDQGERTAFIEELLKHGEAADYELHLKAGDGRVVPSSASARIRHNADGTPAAIEGTLRDVTDRKRAEEALRESEERLRTVVRNAPVVLFALDREGVYTLYEGKALAALGLEPGEYVGRSVFDVYRDRTDVQENARRALRGETLTTAFERAGTLFEVHFSPMHDQNGEVSGVIGVGTDVTERQQVEDMLRRQATSDPLTGVLNHGAIVEELRTFVSEEGKPARCAVGTIDVDGLKAINDTFGHQVGDAVLIAVAKALSHDGTLVGRYGGDEFVVVLPNADRNAAERYRDEVLKAMDGAALTDPESGVGVPVLASIGFAICPEDATEVAELVKLSDSAMYGAKRQRPAGRPGPQPVLPLGRDRAAEMVGQIVPLLTSPGDLEDKLRLVGHRIAAGAGYDAVSIDLRSRPDAPPTIGITFAENPPEMLEAWQREARPLGDDPFTELLTRTRRPIIIEDPQNDERLTEPQRQVLRTAQLGSAVVIPLFWQDELVGILSVAREREGTCGPGDVQFLTTIAGQVTAIIRMATLVEELDSTSKRLVRSHDDTVMMLAAAAEAHDRTTGRHLRGVRALTRALARELGTGEQEAADLGMAAVLHDIGKVRVPDIILASTGQLTDHEWELLKQHTVWGEEFLRGRLGFEQASTIARSHHERWDGSGYPDGLSGDQIAGAAHIVAVADAFDAMTHDRPYRAARDIESAIVEVKANSGAQFSPEVVGALLRLCEDGGLPALDEVALDQEAAA